ncbi:cysteine proteinase, partial [Rhizodiscina lignyota]
DSPTASNKKGVVGLTNPANDCFINSILQALAGLPDLRVYLIREVHRRKLDGPEIYAVTPQDAAELEKKRGADSRQWKLEGLRQGVVTKALKQVLDRLNERPIYRKTISAQEFVVALEKAFRTRISRQQQDAQEFLQIVTERLCDEYHAGATARKRARDALNGSFEVVTDQESGPEYMNGTIPGPVKQSLAGGNGYVAPEEEGFPFEGKLESQIECLTCHFKPKPTVSTFVTLTLSVPQKSSTSLNECYDRMFKRETIEDYKCEYCRLEGAIELKKRELKAAKSSGTQQQLEDEISKLQLALQEDPENPPEDIVLPDSKYAPKRKIERYTRISSFPKILAIHLSRSLYSAATLSTKNMAKVSFPESWPLGEVLNHRRYRLLGTVTHKGGHNSGHYESFRRQVVPEPFSTPHSFGTEGVYSVQPSPNPSAVQSPRMSARTSRESDKRLSKLADRSAVSSPSLVSPTPSSVSSQSSLSLSSTKKTPPAPTSAPKEDDLSIPVTPSPAPSPRPVTSASKVQSAPNLTQLKRSSKRKNNRWWRISDEKVKEARTSDVLGMQKEVYLLFYELDRRTED